MENKKYNPFKMWGSWVGGILPLAFFTYWAIFLCEKNTIGETQLCLPATIVEGIVGIIIGFLIGWGIHSLIRRLRK